MTPGSILDWDSSHKWSLGCQEPTSGAKGQVFMGLSAAEQAAEEVIDEKKATSGAKARFYFQALNGTSKLVLFPILLTLFFFPQPLKPCPSRSIPLRGRDGRLTSSGQALGTARARGPALQSFFLRL